MSMLKKGVTTKADIDIIGASCDEGYICNNCHRVVISSVSDKCCPFCNSKKLPENNIKE